MLAKVWIDESWRTTMRRHHAIEFDTLYGGSGGGGGRFVLGVSASDVGNTAASTDGVDTTKDGRLVYLASPYHLVEYQVGIFSLLMFVISLPDRIWKGQIDQLQAEFLCHGSLTLRLQPQLQQRFHRHPHCPN